LFSEAALADAAAAASIALSAVVAFSALVDLYLIAVHLGLGRRALAQERVWLRSPVAVKPNLSVCVQVAVFNEPDLVAPAIDALCALEWPGRLEIQVLDDSTDETTYIAAKRVAHWKALGVAVDHVWRSHRREHKAGALAGGLQRTTADVIAIFDVDYRPHQSFLRETIPLLAVEPRAAFVQARVDCRNRDHSLLTRAQAMQLDIYYAHEQASRTWAGIPTPFDGTCAVWRRAAIHDAGGWRGDSVAEDLDLSLRAFARGWTSLRLMTVAVKGELPETFTTLVSQRRRWSLGTSQTFRTLPWRLLRGMRWDRALMFSLLSFNLACQTLLLPVILMLALASWLVQPAAGTLAILCLAGVVTIIVVLRTFGAALACQATGRPLGEGFLLDVIGMWLMEAALIPFRVKAQFEGLLGRRIAFSRTPKGTREADPRP
jgi:cellulose synthase/poly-beta-1,6-N-acetylglucosamine synthase-like glycosyltransferase